jgi:hypothetical protein
LIEDVEIYRGYILFAAARTVDAKTALSKIFPLLRTASLSSFIEVAGTTARNDWAVGGIPRPDTANEDVAAATSRYICNVLGMVSGLRRAGPGLARTTITG